MRAVALLSLLAAGLFAGMAAAPVYAQERQPAQATQHALDELANAVAQGKITLTPTSTPTLTPTSTPTPVPTSTPEPTETDTPVPTAIPTMPIADDPSNAYLRPGPDDWLELALPQGRWLIQSTDCKLTPWTQVSYHTSTPTTAGVNDCPLSTWQQVSETPCAMNDDGVCDLASDASYLDYLNEVDPATPTPIPEPPTATTEPRAQPAARVAPVAAPPQAAAAVPQPTPIYVVVTATADPPSPTATRTVRPTATVTLTRTPVPTPTQFPTATAVPTATVLLVAATADRLPPLPFDWTGVFIVLGVLVSVGGITAFVVHRLRQRHLAQLAELDGVME